MNLKWYEELKNKSKTEKLNLVLDFYYNGKHNKALYILKNMLKDEPYDLDVLFNLANIYYRKKNWKKLKKVALKYYKKDKNNWAINDMLADLWLVEGDFDKAILSLEAALKNAPSEYLKNLKEKLEIFKYKIKNAKNKKKIAFICLDGLDNFIDDIIVALSDEYWSRKFVISDKLEIYKAIDWGDIIWFEWANNVAILGSNFEGLSNKPAIIRLHSYEALGDYPKKINWKNIDKLIFVSEHIKDILKIHIPNIENIVDIDIINNGINLENTKFSEKNKGFNIGVVANISHKKNPSMMLQIIKKLVEIDSKYKLHIAGEHLELRYMIYFQHMIKEMGLENNIIFYGFIEDINEWLEDKNYILSTSIHEGHPLNIIESMAMGIKPVIHNYFGSKKQWPNELIFNTIDEAVDIILEEDYDSRKYRTFVEKNYDFKKEILRIKNLINTLNKERKNIKVIQKKLISRPDYLKNNEYLLNYYLNKNEIEKYIKLVEYLLINGKLELKNKIDYFLRNLYYRMESYSRFEYLSEEPFKYLENIGWEYFDKFYKVYFNNTKTKNNDKDKIHFLYILNGLDYFQILFRFVFESIVNSPRENIEYHVLSLLDEKSFNNADFARKILEKHKIDYFIPEPTEKMEYRLKQYYEYISKINPDIAFFHSFYFSPYGILIYPLLKQTAKLIGRHITQDIEPYFDKKLDFVYTGLNEPNIPTKNIFFRLPPVDSNIINKNLDIKKQLKIPRKNKVIISIGRPIKYKNKKYWEVIKKLADEIEDITFVFFGPKYDNYFKELIPKSYIESGKIALLGPDLNARSYLKSCDYYINSAPNGGGISFNEAYYAELPIITFIKDLDPRKKTIETRVNYLPAMFYHDAFKIFPHLGDYHGFYEFAKRIIMDEEFKNFIQSKRKIDKNYLEYKNFVQEFEDYILKLLRLK
ncbi:glycosyltransferase [Thermosipho melanesiensis]|uniref:Glycosyl transferase, group 1 n=2 Tax=Thermosipho melanesiensis TaxID=46541 RepID=A6LKC9_THEM4|nr:glycosyltransferase [Thermosipho melanesiensis]ABR30380.1 glycosyl transferase, group 1 [Thermosipho melanesiensis BI429]APT73542.1 glycosyl transferase family 1 [Thermosipho melanesiensis]